MYTNQFTYDITKFKLYYYMKSNYVKIKKDFFKNNNSNITVFAHNTTDMFKKDYNYKYIKFKQFNYVNHKNSS